MARKNFQPRHLNSFAKREGAAGEGRRGRRESGRKQDDSGRTPGPLSEALGRAVGEEEERLRNNATNNHCATARDSFQPKNVTIFTIYIPAGQEIEVLELFGDN